MKHFHFTGLRRPVVFLNRTERLLETLAGITCGWRWQTVSRPPEEPAIRVRREDGDYLIEAAWLDKPVREADELRAAGNLAVDLLECYLAENPSRLCLHCGAASFDGRLVILPASARTGKSTLMARLAADGIPILGDDVLTILDEGEARGMSLGLSPRVRLPLPEKANPLLSRFVAHHGGPGDSSAVYLRLPRNIRPEVGRSAPIGAVVMLERVAYGTEPARLTSMTTGNAVNALLPENLSRGMDSTHQVQRLHQLVARLPCFRLTYADLEDAFHLITRSFPAQFDHVPSITCTPDSDTAEAVLSNPVYPLVPPDCRYRRNPALSIRPMKSDLYLVDCHTRAVHHLNPVAAGIWHLLETPTSLEEAVAVLQEAFPDQDRDSIRSDVERLFRDLHNARIILPGNHNPHAA